MKFLRKIQAKYGVRAAKKQKGTNLRAGDSKLDEVTQMISNNIVAYLNGEGYFRDENYAQEGATKLDVSNKTAMKKELKENLEEIFEFASEHCDLDVVEERLFDSLNPSKPGNRELKNKVLMDYIDWIEKEWKVLMRAAKAGHQH
jgi:replication fork clamp-binding protein CrfC